MRNVFGTLELVSLLTKYIACSLELGKEWALALVYMTQFIHYYVINFLLFSFCCFGQFRGYFFFNTILSCLTFLLNLLFVFFIFFDLSGRRQFQHFLLHRQSFGLQMSKYIIAFYISLRQFLCVYIYIYIYIYKYVCSYINL